MITVALKCVESIHIVSHVYSGQGTCLKRHSVGVFFFFFFFFFFFLVLLSFSPTRTRSPFAKVHSILRGACTLMGPMAAPVGYARRWRPCLQPSRLEFQIFTLDAIDYRTGRSHEPRSFSPLTDRPERAPTTTLGKKIDHGVLQASRVRQSGPSHD